MDASFSSESLVESNIERRKIHLILEVDVILDADDEEVAVGIHDVLLKTDFYNVPGFVDLFGVAIMKEDE